MRRTAVFKLGTLAALFILAVMLIACEDSDPTAVEGSQFIITATPNPVDLTANPLGQSTVSARLLTATGVPQSGTAVFFSTSNGTVSPDTDTTDDDGVALTTFASPTAVNASVEATSGGSSGTIQITVIIGTPNTHQLLSSDPVIDTICTNTIPLEGFLLDSALNTIPSVLVTYSVVSSTVNGNPASPPLNGTFNPTSTLTGTGKPSYTAVFTMNQADCTNNCQGADACTLKIRAVGAGVDSNDLLITENL